MCTSSDRALPFAYAADRCYMACTPRGTVASPADSWKWQWLHPTPHGPGKATSPLGPRSSRREARGALAGSKAPVTPMSCNQPLPPPLTPSPDVRARSNTFSASYRPCKPSSLLRASASEACFAPHSASRRWSLVWRWVTCSSICRTRVLFCAASSDCVRGQRGQTQGSDSQAIAVPARALRPARVGFGIVQRL